MRARTHSGLQDSLAATLDENSGTQQDVPILDEQLSAHDDDSEFLVYSLLRQSTHGNVTLLSRGTFSYMPDSGFTGNDSFTFFVTDLHSGTITRAVDIWVE